MKKTLLALFCTCSLLFVSCASKPAAEAQNENKVEAPETAEENTESEDNTEFENSSEETNQSEEEFSENSENQNEAADNNDDELEDIIEPVVITLDYEEEEEEPEFENQDTQENEILPSEPIEVETPPELPSDTEVTEPQTDESEDIIDAENEEDDVISVIEPSSDSDDIDITDENDDDSQEESLEEEEIIPSRKVTVKKQEYIDVTYPGNGWVYMGLTDGSKDIAYFGRKLGTSDTKFTLQAKNAGTKIVHFYKNDALTNQYIDDYMEIEVLAEKGSNKTHIEAPEYKQPSPKKKKVVEEPAIEVIESQPGNNSEIKEVEQNTITPVETKNTESTDNKTEAVIVPSQTETQPQVQTQSQTEATVVEEKKVPDTNTLLQEAQVLYNEKEYKSSLEKLNQFFEYSTNKRDEALFLKGQILEAKSEIQDIKASLEAYTTLTKNYPASKYWDKANKRIIYLKRFYFGG